MMEGRLFFCLGTGIFLAIAFQWVLTTLSLAAGFSALGARRGQSQKTADSATEAGSRPLSMAVKISRWMGAWAMASTSLAVFFAAWAVTELLHFGAQSEALFLGVAIWAGFISAMMAMEALALGSLMGAVMGVLKQGLGILIAPLKSASEPATPSGRSPEAIAKKVREEFRSESAGPSLKNRLSAYVEKLQTEGEDEFEIDREVDDLFNDEEIRAMARRRELQKTDRNRFREMVASRGDISAEESGHWAEAMQARWDALREGALEGAQPDPLRVERLPQDVTPRSSANEIPNSPEHSEANKSRAGLGQTSQGAKAQPVLEGGLAGAGEPSKTDPSPEVSAGFKERLQGFQDFLVKSDRRELNPVRLEKEVEALVVHPEEGFDTIQKSARSMKREDIVKVLRQRIDLSSKEADSIADLVDSARTRMLSRAEIREHRKEEATDKAFARLRDRVYALKRPERDYDAFVTDINALVEDVLPEFEENRESPDRNALVKLFSEKQGISRQDAQRMADFADEAIRRGKETAQKITAETEKRIEEGRIATLAEADGARELAASAAWWLFSISVVTGGAGALGGWLGS